MWVLLYLRDIHKEQDPHVILSCIKIQIKPTDDALTL